MRTVYTGCGFAVPADGKLIISAAYDRVVVLEYDTGAVLASASTGDGETIAHVCCSDDGKWVFSSSRSLDGTLWRVITDEFFEVTLKKERTWTTSKHPVTSCAFSPTVSSLEYLWLATACTDGAIRLWEPTANSLTHTLQNDGGIILSVSYVTVSDHVFMVGACMNGSVSVWDVASQERVLVLHDHVGGVEAVEFFYSGAMMVTGGKDGMLNVYRLSATSSVAHTKKRKRTTALTFEAIKSHSFTVLEEISSIARMTKMHFGAHYGSVIDDPEQDKEAIMVGGEHGKLRYFYLERTGRGRKCKKEFGASDSITEIAVENGHKQRHPKIVRIVPVKQHNEVIVATEDHDLDFFTPTLTRKRLIVGKIDQILDSKYGHDDQIVAASNSASVRIFHQETPYCEILFGHNDVVLTLAVSQCKKYLATGGKDHTIRFWELKTLKCLAVMTGHTGDVTGLSFGHPVGNSSAATVLLSASADLSLKLWDVRDLMAGEKQVARLQQQQGIAAHVPLAIESTPNNTTPRAHEQDISSVCMSPTAEMAASSSKDKTVRIWGVTGKTLQLMASHKGHKKRVHCTAFSTHEKVVASGSGDTTIKLWSINQGEGCIKTLQGHETPVLTLTFINNGLQILSASSDGVMKVWGLKQQSCLASLSRHTDRVWSIDVDRSDEMHFLSSGSDGVINVWKDFTEDDHRDKEMKKHLKVKQTQLLSDKMRNKQYAEALELCLRLDHPRDMKEALTKLAKEGSAEEHLRSVIDKIDGEMLSRFIGYVKKWMLNALSSDVAAVSLKALLSAVHITRLAEDDDIKLRLATLLSYGTRHHDRMRQHLQQLHLVSLFTGEDPAVPKISSEDP